MEIFEYVVDSETEGMRIDRYLKKTFKNEPLSKIFQALRKGDVKVGGKKVKENYRLSLNEKIFIFKYYRFFIFIEYFFFYFIFFIIFILIGNCFSFQIFYRYFFI